MTTSQAVLDFWFNDKTQPKWFAKDADFDREIREQFFATWQAAKRGECADWRQTLRGRLAEIIVLDQFSRNLCRDSGEAYAQDDMAVILAQEAVKHPDYTTLSPAEKQFLLMPFMHSESAVIHERALPLFKALGNENLLDYEARHRELIDTYGRYPYRNAVLGRASTLEEIEYLKDPNAGF